MIVVYTLNVLYVVNERGLQYTVCCSLLTVCLLKLKFKRGAVRLGDLGGPWVFPRRVKGSTEVMRHCNNN